MPFRPTWSPGARGARAFMLLLVQRLPFEEMPFLHAYFVFATIDWKRSVLRCGQVAQGIKILVLT